MDKRTQAAMLLPNTMQKMIKPYLTEKCEEIRLRAGQHPAILCDGREILIRDCAVSTEEIYSIFEKATGASISAHLSQLKQGYLDYQGLRIGFCATAVYNDSGLSGFRDISSLCIRLPSEFTGDMSEIMKKLPLAGNMNTLILSPPGGGKTTLLRALLRTLSEKGIRVCVVDERNELASMQGNSAYFNLGPHTDIMVGINKCEGAMMLLRGMNPQLVGLDEISKKEDAEALLQIIGCGVSVIATAHGSEKSDLYLRPAYRLLMESAVFSGLITISLDKGNRQYHYERL